MGSTRHTPDDDRGFTVLEVLVALVITLVSLAVSYRAISASLFAAHDTARWDRAIARAESHMAAISNPAVVLGERQGEEGDGFHWRTRVALIGAAPASNPQRGGVWAHGTGLYAVSVTVSWRMGDNEQHFELDSAELGPVSGDGP